MSIFVIIYVYMSFGFYDNAIYSPPPYYIDILKNDSQEYVPEHNIHNQSSYIISSLYFWRCPAIIFFTFYLDFFTFEEPQYVYAQNKFVFYQHYPPSPIFLAEASSCDMSLRKTLGIVSLHCGARLSIRTCVHVHA
jgi:hypothetical protein